MAKLIRLGFTEDGVIYDLVWIDPTRDDMFAAMETILGTSNDDLKWPAPADIKELHLRNQSLIERRHKPCS